MSAKIIQEYPSFSAVNRGIAFIYSLARAAYKFINRKNIIQGYPSSASFPQVLQNKDAAPKKESK
jgi:hypothetical protein